MKFKGLLQLVLALAVLAIAFSGVSIAQADSVAATATTSGCAPSQIHQLDGEATGDQFGYSVDGAGDVNSDGFDDIIIGAHLASPNAMSAAGSAYVYDGQSGALLLEVDGSASSDNLGVSVAGAGDVNNDGFDDVIIGANHADPGGNADAGSAFVYSGQTGALLYQFDGSTGDQLGISVNGAGDVNSDGFDDLIIGAHRADVGANSSAGSAYVYSGQSGALLYQFDGAAVGDQLGYAVAGAGDVNNDGFADVIIAAPETDVSGNTATGSA